MGGSKNITYESIKVNTLDFAFSVFRPEERRHLNTSSTITYMSYGLQVSPK